LSLGGRETAGASHSFGKIIDSLPGLGIEPGIFLIIVAPHFLVPTSICRKMG
jgi:hypothetical protein